MATITKFNLWTKNQLDGTSIIDFNTDTIKTMLVTNSYVPAATTHDFIDDANANEVTGTNYTAGGDPITTKVLSETGGTVTFDGDDNTWTQSGAGFANARYAIIYKDSGTPSTSPMVGYVDFTADKGNVSGDLTVQWGGTGIFTLV